MRLAQARIYCFESGGLRPVILELSTDTGITGLGEASVAYGTGSPAAAAMLKDMIQRHVTGATDPFRIEKLWSEIYDHSFWAKGGGSIVLSAMSALEQALLDIKARALNIPVYDLLGGRVHDHLRTYCNGWYFGCRSDAEMPAAAVAAVADGYQALKFYPLATILDDGRLRHPSYGGLDDPHLVRRAVARVGSIRRAIGDDVELMLDLSAGMTPHDTIRFCREIEDDRISFIEEPAIPGDHAALSKIGSRIAQPIAVGERIYGRHGFRDLLESRAADIIQPDVGNTGGVLETRKIAAMAEAYGLKVQPHVCGSALSTAVAMHLSASLPNFYVQEHFPYWHRVPGHRDLLENPIEDDVEGGVMPVRTEPGFGVTLRRQALEGATFAQIFLT